MRVKRGYVLAAVAVLGLVPAAHAAPTVEIAMEQSTFSYCEKLFYTIRVSEVTGDVATIHIRDSEGKGSSAIPVAVDDYETPVPSRVAFSEDIFPRGVYFIDVEYSGGWATAEFVLVDSGKRCLPELLKPYIANWVGGYVSSWIVIDALEKYVDKEIIEVPFQVTEHNMNDVHIPFWVKGIAFWWIEGSVSDEEFIGALDYLMDEGIITVKLRNGA